MAGGNRKEYKMYIKIAGEIDKSLPESARLSKAELQCSLCLLDIVIDGLSKDEFSCPNKELIRLVIMYVYIQERFDLCEIKELHTKLVMTPVKKKKE